MRSRRLRSATRRGGRRQGRKARGDRAASRFGEDRRTRLSLIRSGSNAMAAGRDRRAVPRSSRRTPFRAETCRAGALPLRSRNAAASAAFRHDRPRLSRRAAGAIAAALVCDRAGPGAGRIRHHLSRAGHQPRPARRDQGVPARRVRDAHARRDGPLADRGPPGPLSLGPRALHPGGADARAVRPSRASCGCNRCSSSTTPRTW